MLSLVIHVLIDLLPNILQLIVRTVRVLDASALRLLLHFDSLVLFCSYRKHLLDPTIDYKVGSGVFLRSCSVY